MAGIFSGLFGNAGSVYNPNDLQNVAQTNTGPFYATGTSYDPVAMQAQALAGRRADMRQRQEELSPYCEEERLEKLRKRLGMLLANEEEEFDSVARRTGAYPRSYCVARGVRPLLPDFLSEKDNLALHLMAAFPAEHGHIFNENGAYSLNVSKPAFELLKKHMKEISEL